MAAQGMYGLSPTSPIRLPAPWHAHPNARSLLRVQYANLKKLQNLKDKLEIKKEDVTMTTTALEEELHDCDSKEQQLQLVNSQIASVLQEMAVQNESMEAEVVDGSSDALVESQLTHSFERVIELSLKDLREEKRLHNARATEADEIAAAIREVSILFEDDEAVLRVVNGSYTFKELKEDVCKYFEVHPLDVALCDDEGSLWGAEVSVRDALALYDNAYGRVILKFHEEKAEEEEEDADDIHLLLGKHEEVDVAAEITNYAAGPTATPKKSLDRRALIRELPVFLVFALMFVVSMQTRRDVPSIFRQVNMVFSAARLTNLPHPHLATMPSAGREIRLP